MPATQPALPRLLPSIAAALLCIAGCVAPRSEVPISADRAERLARQGDDAAAAEMYERLAQDNPAPDRNDFAIAAARAWLAANRADDAQRALNLAAAENRAAPQLELGMTRAEVAEARGQHEFAWQQVSVLQIPADATTASRLLKLRQQIALRVGQPIEAVRAGVARERAATTDEARTTARRDLLTDLRGALEGGLRVDPASSNDAMVRGWLELAQIAVAVGQSPMTAASEIARWRSRFPGHPGMTIVEGDILRPGEQLADSGRGTAGTGPVALLLPLTGGSFAAQAGLLIRSGFEAAIARLPESERPALLTYDTGTVPVGDALQGAQVAGAGFIVGPLTRPDVQTAFERRPGNLPMLLLNMLPGSSFVGSQVYQYALAPEDEARQIARQIAGSGRRNALVLAPAGEWGTRVANAFAAELTRGGGTVVAQGNYTYDLNDRSKTDVEATITRALGIDEARSRFERVRQIIGGAVQFKAYPRPDLDAIFVAGFEPQATSEIKPQLFFYEAGNLPTYVTQDGVDAGSKDNSDLEGMRLLAMPWELDSIGPVADLRNATETRWSAQEQRLSRYFAFGYDAATLAIALRRGITAWPLAGLTGRLQLTPDGRIERSLNWGVLKKGEIQPFDPVSN